MPEPQVIYAAANMQQAYLLKSVLADRGIVAIVANGMLQGGSGVDMVGWPTLARVVVAECDAVLARQIALEFDRRTAGGDDGDGPGETFERPKRGRRRPMANLSAVRGATLDCLPHLPDGRERLSAGRPWIWWEWPWRRPGARRTDGRRFPLLRPGRMFTARRAAAERRLAWAPGIIAAAAPRALPDLRRALRSAISAALRVVRPRICRGRRRCAAQIEAEPLNGRVFVALAAIVGLVLAAVFYLTALSAGRLGSLSPCAGAGRGEGVLITCEVGRRPNREEESRKRVSVATPQSSLRDEGNVGASQTVG